MIIANHTTFRSMAAVRVTSSPTATFNNANPDTITRTDLGGDYVAEGVIAGMVTRPSGTANNDGFLFTIDPDSTVVAASITLIDDDAVVVEGPVACALDCYWLDRDGFEEFPGPFGHTNLVRAAGFDGGFTGIPQPWTWGEFDVTVNAYAADAAPLTDEYHWYMSQRTDDPAAQLLSIVPYTDVLGQTYSGSVTINSTALAVSALGVADPATPTDSSNLFKHCDLYCIRISGGEIQWINLLKDMVGA